MGIKGVAQMEATSIREAQMEDAGINEVVQMAAASIKETVGIKDIAGIKETVGKKEFQLDAAGIKDVQMEATISKIMEVGRKVDVLKNELVNSRLQVGAHSAKDRSAVNEENNFLEACLRH